MSVTLNNRGWRAQQRFLEGICSLQQGNLPWDLHGKKMQKPASLMSQAAGEGASLLVLPEALLARDDLDPDLSVKSAQLLEGGF